MCAHPQGMRGVEGSMRCVARRVDHNWQRWLEFLQQVALPEEGRIASKRSHDVKARGVERAVGLLEFSMATCSCVAILAH
eukprot:11185121-Lingulodinium_polyedra.AAC.1